MENWRNYQKETLTEGSMEDLIRSQNLQTYGDLVEFIKKIRSDKRAKKGGKAIFNYFADMAGKNLVEFIWQTYFNGKPPKAQDILKLFRVDDKIAAIVDNDVEEAFIQKFLEAMENPNSEMSNIRLDDPQFNMTNQLAAWISNNFDGRTVDISKADRENA